MGNSSNQTLMRPVKVAYPGYVIQCNLQSIRTYRYDILSGTVEEVWDAIAQTYPKIGMLLRFCS